VPPPQFFPQDFQLAEKLLNLSAAWVLCTDQPVAFLRKVFWTDECMWWVTTGNYVGRCKPNLKVLAKYSSLRWDVSSLFGWYKNQACQDSVFGGNFHSSHSSSVYVLRETVNVTMCLGLPFWPPLSWFCCWGFLVQECVDISWLLPDPQSWLLNTPVLPWTHCLWARPKSKMEKREKWKRLKGWTV